MRILYIVTAFPRHDRDVITPWMLETIFRLRDAGIEVEVLAPAYRGLADQEFEGIRVHRFRYAPAFLETLTHDQTVPDRLRSRPWLSLLLPGYLLGGVLRARKLARSGHFDAFHAFWPVPHSVIGDLARRRTQIPLISTFFGVELTWVRRDLPFLSGVVRWVTRRSDRVTAISSYTAEQVHSYSPSAEVTVIPFGAAARPAGGDQPSRSVRDQNSAFRLLFVGRLVERKGVRYLLEALARVGGGRVELTVAGDGPLRVQLERQARELGLDRHVRFTGFISDSELASVLVECDALVLPAVEDAKGDVEGLGVVLIEAIQAGKPVIASRSGGITDIVVDGETGLLVAPGDADALARAIQRLRNDPDLGSRLVQGGMRRIDEKFSWERIIEDLEKLYVAVAKPSVENRLNMLGGQ